MPPDANDSRPNLEVEAAGSRSATTPTIANSETVAAWLGIEAWQFPDLRAQRRDHTPKLLDAMLRARPGDVARGGGTQWQWPDGTWRRRQPRGDNRVVTSPTPEPWSCIRGSVAPASPFVWMAA